MPEAYQGQPQQPHVDELTEATLRQADVVEVWLSAPAASVYHALLQLADGLPSWTGPQRDIVITSGYSQRSVTIALPELEEAGLLMREQEGRSLRYWLRPATPEGAPYVVRVSAPRAPLGPSQQPRTMAAAPPDDRSSVSIDDRRTTDPAHTGTVLSSSSSASVLPSSSSGLLPSSSLAAAARDRNAAIRAEVQRADYAEVVSRLRDLDITPEPYLLARIADLDARTQGYLWPHLAGNARGKIARYVDLCIDTVIAEMATSDATAPPATDHSESAQASVQPDGSGFSPSAEGRRHEPPPPAPLDVTWSDLARIGTGLVRSLRRRAR